jgi:hypothetical protein
MNSKTPKTIGLYEIVSTPGSVPVTIPEDIAPPQTADEARAAHRKSLEARWRAGASNAKDLLGPIMNNPLPRVREWLGNILTNIGTIRGDPRQPESVKAFAERCSTAATRLLDLLKQMQDNSTHSAQFVAQGMEIAAELADEWHSLQVSASLEKPILRYRSSANTALANTAKHNAEMKADADQNAVAAFDAWKDNARRRDSLAPLLRPEQVKKYLKVGKPLDRVARRLRAMLKDGRIK